MDELVSLYERLFLFLTQWMNLYLSGAKDGKAFADKIKEETNKMIRGAERILHGIVRSGRAGSWNVVVWQLWGSHLVKFEEKKTVEGNVPKELTSSK
ncbi:MAG: hypothetical protein ACREBJ_05885, partial [Nitrosotalea sp.]